MKMDEIINVIRKLSYSQGFYGRLYQRIIELKNNDIDTYEMLKNELESQNFRDDLDMILYFET